MTTDKVLEIYYFKYKMDKNENENGYTYYDLRSWIFLDTVMRYLKFVIFVTIIINNSSDSVRFQTHFDPLSGNITILNLLVTSIQC